MNNKQIGDKYENMFLELLRENGWWAHLFAYKKEGQPCDIIAGKNDTPLWADVKHCNLQKFYFSDIRPNQRTCFSLAYKKGNHNCGFAIYFYRIKQWRWLPYSMVLTLEDKGEKGVNFYDLYPLDEYGIIDKK